MYEKLDKPVFHATSMVKAAKVRSATPCDDGIYKLTFEDASEISLAGQDLVGLVIHRGDYLVVYDDDYITVMDEISFGRLFSRIQ